MDKSLFARRSAKVGHLNKSMEESSACDAVLVPDVTVIQSNLTVLYAFFRIIDASNYSQYQQQYAAQFPGYFDGDYASFEEKRSTFYQQEGVSLEVYEAKSILQTTVGPEKVNAWLQCVTNAGYGIFAYLNDANAQGATLTVEWVPPPGLLALRNPQLVLDGGAALANNFEGQQEFVGTANIAFRRTDASGAVRGTVSGTAGDSGAYSARFYLSPVPQPHEVEINEVLPTSGLFETVFVVPRRPVPKDVTLTLKVRTTVTGEYFTQGNRFIQQYIWVAGNPVAVVDTGEVTGFGEGEVKTLENPVTVQVPAGKQVQVRVRNNHKGAKLGPTNVSWAGAYMIEK